MSGKRGFARAIEACRVDLAPRGRAHDTRLSPAVLAGVILTATAVMAGCGQKGPLVLPDRSSAGAPAPTSSDDEERPATDDRDGTENGADGP